ncbi:hypothetical protein HDV00_011981, partial [Rhizophlyctis rosea]
MEREVAPPQSPMFVVFEALPEPMEVKFQNASLLVEPATPKCDETLTFDPAVKEGANREPNMMDDVVAFDTFRVGSVPRETLVPDSNRGELNVN